MKTINHHISIFKCSTAITVAEAWNANKWTLINTRYAIYNAVLPATQFDIYGLYNVGDVVYYKNKTYTCKMQTQILSHNELLQIDNAAVTNPINIYPDDYWRGVSAWGTGTAYIVPATTDITNTTYWIEGDARDAKLVQVCVDIALYHAHCRIAPNNIPLIRVERYKGEVSSRQAGGQRITYPVSSALGWLQSCQNADDITPSIPLLPVSGATQKGEIRFSGKQKLQNSW